MCGLKIAAAYDHFELSFMRLYSHVSFYRKSVMRFEVKKQVIRFQKRYKWNLLF